MTNDAPNKETKNMAVFIEKLTGADRVVVETLNALGEMDAHYLYAPDILEAFNIRAYQAQAELQAAVAAAYEDCWEQGKQAGRFAPDIPADAQAALEAVKREARNEALREAIEVIRRCKVMPPEDAILALMEDTDDENY